MVESIVMNATAAADDSESDDVGNNGDGSDHDDPDDDDVRDDDAWCCNNSFDGDDEIYFSDSYNSNDVGDHLKMVLRSYESCLLEPQLIRRALTSFSPFCVHDTWTSACL